MTFSFGRDSNIDQIARKARIEVEGGLYHVTTRGVDRRDIFHSPEDYRKFVALFAAQKTKLPFYLYAYCLRTDHIHLLIESLTDDIGRIMHRVLTSVWSVREDAARAGRKGKVPGKNPVAMAPGSDRGLAFAFAGTERMKRTQSLSLPVLTGVWAAFAGF